MKFRLVGSRILLKITGLASLKSGPPYWPPIHMKFDKKIKSSLFAPIFFIYPYLAPIYHFSLIYSYLPWYDHMRHIHHTYAFFYQYYNSVQNCRGIGQLFIEILQFRELKNVYLIPMFKHIGKPKILAKSPKTIKSQNPDKPSRI